MVLGFIILFLLLKLASDEVHIKEFLLPLGWVKAEVLVVCYGLVEIKDDTMQDDVNKVVVRHLGIGFKSIDIVQVFLHSTCLFEITDLVDRCCLDYSSHYSISS